MDEFIKENYMSLTMREIAEKLNKMYPELNGKANKEAIRGRIRVMQKYEIITSHKQKDVVRFTEEEKEWLKNNNYHHNRKELVKLFNEKFGKNKTSGSMHWALHEYCDNSYYDEKFKYTKEEDDWLIENYHKYTNKFLTIEFNKIFRKKTQEALITHCNRELNLNTPILVYDNKIGYKNGNEKELGYISKSSQYYFIKVKNDAKAGKGNFIQKHRYIWEQYHGRKVPEGHMITFLDGNTENFDINNLVCLSASEQGTLIKVRDCSNQIKKLKLASFKLNKILSELDV